MRLQLVTEIDSRDGSVDKDARLTNVLSETGDEGEMLACVRPGLNTISTSSGAGNGVTCFNGVLISAFGTTLGYGNTPTTIGTVTSGKFDFAVMP